MKLDIWGTIKEVYSFARERAATLFVLAAIVAMILVGLEQILLSTGVYGSNYDAYLTGFDSLDGSIILAEGLVALVSVLVISSIVPVLCRLRAESGVDTFALIHQSSKDFSRAIYAGILQMLYLFGWLAIVLGLGLFALEFSGEDLSYIIFVIFGLVGMAAIAYTTLAIVVAVKENRIGLNSLTRSVEVVTGNFFNSVAVYIGVGLGVMVLSAVVGIAIAFMAFSSPDMLAAVLFAVSIVLFESFELVGYLSTIVVYERLSASSGTEDAFSSFVKTSITPIVVVGFASVALSTVFLDNVLVFFAPLFL